MRLVRKQKLTFSCNCCIVAVESRHATSREMRLVRKAKGNMQQKTAAVWCSSVSRTGVAFASPVSHGSFKPHRAARSAGGGKRCPPSVPLVANVSVQERRQVPAAARWRRRELGALAARVVHTLGGWLGLPDLTPTIAPSVGNFLRGRFSAANSAVWSTTRARQHHLRPGLHERAGRDGLCSSEEVTFGGAHQCDGNKVSRRLVDYLAFPDFDS